MRRLVVVLVAFLALSGCESTNPAARTVNFLAMGTVLTPHEIRARWDAQDDTTCRGYGAAPGSDTYVQCRTQLLIAHRQAFQAALAARAQASAAANPGYGGPVSAPRPICSFTGQAVGQGVNICYYNCGGASYISNVPFGQICPIN